MQFLANVSLSVLAIYLIHNYYELISENYFWVFFIYYAVFCTICILLNAFLLEVVYQIETGNKPELWQCIFDMMRHNLIHIFPLGMVWASLLFILLIVESFLSLNAKRKSLKNLVNTGFTLLREGLRMIVFLTLTIITWEEKSLIGAFNKARKSLSGNFSKYFIEYARSRISVIVLLIPVFFVGFMSGSGIEFPLWVIFITLLYFQLVMSFTILLEQLIVAEIVMWETKYLKAIEAAPDDADPEIVLTDIPRPSIFDTVADLR